jgi:glycosyltransferase involved in cell wall biosynthesis
MNKKKILFITPSLCQGGIEHSLIVALKLLDQNKYDLYLYTYNDDLTLLPLVPNGVKVYNDALNKHYQRKPKAIVLKLLSMAFKDSVYQDKLKDYIHRQKAEQPKKYYRNTEFDVVIAYAIGMATEMAANIKADKHLVFFHSSKDLHHNLLIKLFSKFDVIVAVSPGVKDMLCSSYDGIEEKVFVLENYVNADEIIEKADEFIVSNPDGKLVLATCGRLSAEKGFDLAVEAARTLKNKNINYKWYFIGDGDERSNIEKLIGNYHLENNVYITGFTNNPFSYIKCCDIFVQPSYEEAQPLTLLESRILGKPIVSTKTVGGKYILENGAKGVLTGFSGKSLADGIMSLIENPEKMQKLSNLYSLEDNQKEKIVYIEKWNELLN